MVEKMVGHKHMARHYSALSWCRIWRRRRHDFCCALCIKIL